MDSQINNDPYEPVTAGQELACLFVYMLLLGSLLAMMLNVLLTLPFFDAAVVAGYVLAAGMVIFMLYMVKKAFAAFLVVLAERKAKRSGK